jgi:hypothetical protein
MLKNKNENIGFVHGFNCVDSNTFCCVAIGSAIGGFDALKELIASLPNALSAVSFFVAQPIEAEQFNTLVAIIPAGAALSIRRAIQLEAIQPGIIYTVLPNESMELTADGFIKIAALQAVEAGTIADVLFQSLAIFNGQNSIAIVLSGTGIDGAAGIKFVQQAGGKVLVQTPQTANYNGMPLAAIATKCVNEILPVYEMGNVLLKMYLQSIACKSNNATENLHKNDHKNTAAGIAPLAQMQPYSKEKYNLSFAKSGMEAMVKDAIFNSYHHTYIVIDKASNITEVNGDTTLYFNAINGSCINQNLWLVLNGAFTKEVQAAFTNATAGHQVTAGNVKVIVMKGRLIFIRILVQLAGTTNNITSQYVIILEKIETDQLMNSNINTANNAVTDLAIQKLTVQVQ